MLRLCSSDVPSRPPSSAGAAPRITWTLYASDGRVEAYEHFDPPFILQVDEVLERIRNERYRYFDSQVTLFPTLANKYDPEVIRELLPQRHRPPGITATRARSTSSSTRTASCSKMKAPSSREPSRRAIEPGYKPPYYRNRLLAERDGQDGR